MIQDGLRQDFHYVPAAMMGNDVGYCNGIRPGKERYSMRLNSKKIVEAMGAKNLAEETVCSRTGLYQKSFQWIVKGGVASEEAAERIADAIGVAVGEILLPEAAGNVENVIEFTKDSGRATVSFSQGRHKSRIRKLATDRPEECQIVAENMDGSLCAHIPVAWIRINPTKQLSEGQRTEIAGRFKRK